MNIKSTYKLVFPQGELDLTLPQVMGIVNITPDSFYDGGKNFSTTRAVETALEMIEQGAAIIDLGAQSTRPGSTRISAEEELERILSTLQAIRNHSPKAIISIDTYQAQVADVCLAEGADIINDIGGGTLDPQLLNTVAKHKKSYIGMHIQGNPNTMQINPLYNNVKQEVYQFLENLHREASHLGISQIVLDPGIGFGKTIAHNFELINALPEFSNLGCPILMGISRKSFIYKTLGITATESLPATSALHLYCLQKGANILRVHDVTEALQCITLFQNLNNG